MTDQTKIRNFFIIAHIDRVAPNHILRLRRLAKAHPIPLGLLSAKPAALRLCGGPF